MWMCRDNRLLRKGLVIPYRQEAASLEDAGRESYLLSGRRGVEYVGRNNRIIICGQRA